jgi:hypothetical protein
MELFLWKNNPKTLMIFSTSNRSDTLSKGEENEN